MKKKRAIILGMQLAIVAGFSLAFYNYTQNEVQPKQVYVFNKDIGVNTQVTQADLSAVSIPSKAVSTNFAVNPKDIVGKYLNSNAYKGQYVYKQELVRKDQTDPFASMDMSKLRKISIPVTYVDSFAGNIKRGDKVDLVFTGEGTKNIGGQQTPFKYSKVFLQNVYVYNVATDDGYKYVDHSTKSKAEIAGANASSQKIDTSSSNNKIGIVTLAVSLDQAEEIQVRENGGKVSMVGRFDDNQSYETLGFVLGDYSKVFADKASAETGRATIVDNNQYQK
ncbi:Flp pilus assembly protein CpaB (plasmid) [Aneurinibacillus sp. Ricciae_BoGa-3]|uniref:Flp pilus assembly protein CpaB n=1 Tax=Aneurinibacillus sp. Ricciae_BoGa-3 TaxID=3022697 RepID=UPI002341A74E|nr:Flp pilus assembly protein CpaB [Aneurinibacillus sp. Ricciae_BoGa-3]WCK56924.1 Flp pilus assembly protein CpaB [Aneurinibacillus sp. Ricciae_BoGa-3]WCK57747.1 Flp pilus assembly protein CpaB [Aneurinibacillus sp. Ricciae_BoGa-3]